MLRSVTFPIRVGCAPLVRRSVICTAGLRVIPETFVTLPVTVKLCPGAAVRGGELIVFTLTRVLTAAVCAVVSTGRAWAKAGVASSSPTGTTETSLRAGDDKRN